jgi:hypothetical protein
MLTTGDLVRHAYAILGAEPRHRGSDSAGRTSQVSNLRGDRAFSTSRAGVSAYGASVSAYDVRVSAYGISHRRSYRPRQRSMIDHGIGGIAHRTGMIDHGQQ